MDKSKGMLLGLIIGDALGAPYEFGYTAKKIQAEFDGVMRDHRIPKGAYTDDTAMALCLADSLLTCKGYNSYDVMLRYFKWAVQGYRDSQGKPASDIGTQTALAIEDFPDNPVIHHDKQRTRNAGNGGIMRIAPIILASHDESIQKVMELARISSRETHYSYEANAGAEIFGAMLYLALKGKRKQEIVDVIKYKTGDFFNDVFYRVEEAFEMEAKDELLDLGGYVVDTIKIAVWGFLNFDTFEEGMLEVIKLCGDTDTNAAVYGQLAGAYYGYKAIPKKWLDSIQIKDEALKISEELYGTKPSSIIKTRFEEDKDTFEEIRL